MSYQPLSTPTAAPQPAQTAGPVLSIIIISYNTREMTLACLTSVFEQTTTPIEVIVVDNASADGSAEAIAAAFPQVTLLAEDTNHHFAPAHRLAVPLATAPWLLLLNPDTVILDGAIDKLLAFAARTPKAGIWGGCSIFADGSLNPSCCWGRMTVWSTFCRMLGLSIIFPRSEVFNSETYGKWPRDTERDVDIVQGHFFLIKRADWDTLGGFDPIFTMYGEETDLCLRAKKTLGFQPRMTPEAVIIHHGGASETVQADKVVRLMRTKIELIKRHFPRGARRFGVWMFSTWLWSRMVGTRMLARLTKRPRLYENAQVWHNAWSRRPEWRNGMGPAAS